MIFEKQIKEIFSSKLLVRQDNARGIFYFSPEDFPGLHWHSHSFTAGAGHKLSGFFYYYDNPNPGRLVVFDHGMGNGHRAYFREIEKLCAAGYLVYSYDHTGCMRSEGSHIGGFAQSLSDLDDCIKALKKEPSLNERSIAVMGHSWGGFSTMNIAALHPDITHVVSMSGFICVEQILRQELRGLLRLYVPAVLELERHNNPAYADMCAISSLKKTTANVLLIYSADDRTVRTDMHYDPLAQALSGKKNIHFLLVDGKDHSPNYTGDAVAYKDSFWKALQQAGKKGLLSTPEQQKEFMSGFDFYRMTAQDEGVWVRILAHLEDNSHDPDA